MKMHRNCAALENTQFRRRKKCAFLYTEHLRNRHCSLKPGTVNYTEPQSFPNVFFLH